VRGVEKHSNVTVGGRGRLLEFSGNDGAGEAVLLLGKTKNRFAGRREWPELAARSFGRFGGSAFAAQRRSLFFFFFAGSFFYSAGKVSAGDFAATDHGISGGNSNVDSCGKAIDAVSADRKPPSGVEQIADVFADVGELQAFHR